MESQLPRRQSLKAWTPKWKDKLKDMCLQRVRDDRKQLLWKIRKGPLPLSGSSVQNNKTVQSSFRDIVSDELRRVQQITVYTGGNDDQSVAPEGQVTDMLWEYETLAAHAPTELSEEIYLELMLAMERALYDDLQAEMRAQEEALLEDFESTLALEDIALDNLIQNLQDLSADGVLCPLCKKAQLKHSNTVIFCACGDFRLDTKDDQIGLEYLRMRLADVHQDHTDSGCLEQPTFSLEARFGIPALYVTCLKCDTFQWVL